MKAYGSPSVLAPRRRPDPAGLKRLRAALLPAFAHSLFLDSQNPLLVAAGVALVLRR
jgi:hypothetical protein